MKKSPSSERRAKRKAFLYYWMTKLSLLMPKLLPIAAALAFSVSYLSAAS